MKKNVILIMVDQMRYDTLSYNGNKNISTPNLDFMAANGINYINAYSACPTCVPARMSLLTGLNQKHHGRVGYVDGVEFDFNNTIATYFSQRGYYTKCVGKMHVYPPRKMCGFHHIDLHDGYLHFNRKEDGKYKNSFENSDDYLLWLKEQLKDVDINDSGINCNSYIAKPFIYEERYHPTNWVVTKSIEFLKKRDETMPFFLKMSFVRPHSPYDPPKYYFDMYLDKFKEMDITKLGNWEKEFLNLQKVYDIDPKKGLIKEDEVKRMLAGYYGSITHIDNQIGRFMIYLEELNLLHNSVILFISDHGDEMYDHGLFRKGYPYQGSIHIPMFIYDPSNKKSIISDTLVDISDILPTLIDLGTNDKILELDGKTVANLENNKEYIHGEHVLDDYSSQFIVDKKYKYIWFPKKNVEQLFNLLLDPNELNDISKVDKETLLYYRNILIKELEDREEGFVKEGKLNKVDEINACLKFIRDKNDIK